MSTPSNNAASPAANAANPISRRIVMPRPAAPTGPDGSAIPERTLCLVLDLKVPGNSRRVSAAQVDVDADRDSMVISKRLLQAHSFLAVGYFDAKMRRYLNAHTLPSLFRGGVYLLPIASVEEIDARLQAFQTERQQLIEAFVAEYPQLVEEARQRLRSLFRADDYPPVETLRRAFAFEWRYVTIGVPSTLAVIDRTIFAREREKAARQWDEAATVIQAMLRTHMAELVRHMTSRLTPEADGTKRIFRDSMVTNMTEFLRTFSARNIVDDDELAALVERARAMLEGVEPNTLRTSDDLRATVHEGFSEIQRGLDRMITNRPARRIIVNRPAAAEPAMVSTPQSAAFNDPATTGTQSVEQNLAIAVNAA